MLEFVPTANRDSNAQHQAHAWAAISLTVHSAHRQTYAQHAFQAKAKYHHSTARLVSVAIRWYHFCEDVQVAKNRIRAVFVKMDFNYPTFSTWITLKVFALLVQLSTVWNAESMLWIQLKPFVSSVLQDTVWLRGEIFAFNVFSLVLRACHFLDQKIVLVALNLCSFRKPTPMVPASETAFLDALHQMQTTCRYAANAPQASTLQRMGQDATGTVLSTVCNALQMWVAQHAWQVSLWIHQTCVSNVRPEDVHLVRLIDASIASEDFTWYQESARLALDFVWTAQVTQLAWNWPNLKAKCCW